ncbi:hypothetical protein AAU61_03770 [Desulfocarbo indianensis]|nr:hypothetical protein AAU61_03770 [Desulfocarbo indianensis]
MKAKLDIWLGVAAWLIALVVPYLEFFATVRHEYLIKEWVAPVLWCCAVLTMMAIRRRHMKKLWWVWPSAPFAFLIWLGGMMIFIAWSTK